jgi:gliding motility-associated-like protein
MMKKLLLWLFSVLSISSYSQVYVPNVFTPNGDGVNDVFLISTDDNLVMFDLIIYNIAGEMIFHTTDPKQAWVGGHEYYAPDDVYIYRLMYRSEYQSNEKIETGSITLVR